MYENILTTLNASGRTICAYDILYAMLAETTDTAIHETYDSGRYFEIVIGQCGRNAQRGHWTQTPATETERAMRAYAQKCADLHYWAATHEDGHISSYDSPVYLTTQKARRDAIRAAYPKLDEADIEGVLDILLDCNESVWYCVERYFEDKLYMTDEYALKVLIQHFELLAQCGPIVYN